MASCTSYFEGLIPKSDFDIRPVTCPGYERMILSKEIFTHPTISEAGALESITSVLRKGDPAHFSCSASQYIDHTKVF